MSWWPVAGISLADRFQVRAFQAGLRGTFFELVDTALPRTVVIEADSVRELGWVARLANRLNRELPPDVVAVLRLAADNLDDAALALAAARCLLDRCIAAEAPATEGKEA